MLGGASRPPPRAGRCCWPPPPIRARTRSCSRPSRPCATEAAAGHRPAPSGARRGGRRPGGARQASRTTRQGAGKPSAPTRCMSPTGSANSASGSAPARAALVAGSLLPEHRRPQSAGAGPARLPHRQRAEGRQLGASFTALPRRSGAGGLGRRRDDAGHGLRGGTEPSDLDERAARAEAFAEGLRGGSGGDGSAGSSELVAPMKLETPPPPPPRWWYVKEGAPAPGAAAAADRSAGVWAARHGAADRARPALRSGRPGDLASAG